MADAPPSPAPSPSVAESLDDLIWLLFTYYPNTLYWGPSLVDNDWQLVESDTACAELCLADPRCQMWSWCPADAGDG